MKDRLQQIHEAIERYKTVPEVRLVAVTKTASPAQMIEAYQLGIRDFGENKPQAALEKMAALPPEIASAVNWHLIGHLQANKVNKVVGKFDWIHSVDSLPLAKKIASRAQTLGLQQKVLLQVNLVPEAGDSRSGFSELTLRQSIAEIIRLEGLLVCGLMTMAPNTRDEASVHSVFCRLRLLRDDRSVANDFPLPELSMGMSQDFVHALQNGATIIRLGSYIF